MNMLDHIRTFLIKKIFKINISYNIVENSIFIQIPDNLKIIVNNDIDLNIKGELSAVTYGKPIILDSLHSKIYLNSLQGKSIRKVKKYIDLRKERSQKKDHVKRINSELERDKIQDLYTVIGKLNEKINELESKIGDKYVEPSKE